MNRGVSVVLIVLCTACSTSSFRGIGNWRDSADAIVVTLDIGVPVRHASDHEFRVVQPANIQRILGLLHAITGPDTWSPNISRPEARVVTFRIERKHGVEERIMIDGNLLTPGASVSSPTCYKEQLFAQQELWDLVWELLFHSNNIGPP
jgi:hypothetical protein